MDEYHTSELQKKDEIIQRLVAKRDLLEAQIKECKQEKDKWKEKYTKLYESCRYVSPQTGLIIHLEDMWFLYKNLYEALMEKHLGMIERYKFVDNRVDNRKKNYSLVNRRLLP